MSEPTKGLPSDTTLSLWADDYKRKPGGILDAMAAEILRLSAELAKASAAVQQLVERNAQVEEKASRYLDQLTAKPVNPKDDPPADVLGEAYREAIRKAGASGPTHFNTNIWDAVVQLAQAVERIARAQRAGGGK